MFWEKNLALLTNRSCFANSGASWQILKKKKKATSAVLCVIDLLVNEFGGDVPQMRGSTGAFAHVGSDAKPSERPHTRR